MSRYVDDSARDDSMVYVPTGEKVNKLENRFMMFKATSTTFKPEVLKALEPVLTKLGIDEEILFQFYFYKEGKTKNEDGGWKSDSSRFPIAAQFNKRKNPSRVYVKMIDVTWAPKVGKTRSVASYDIVVAECDVSNYGPAE